MKTSVIVVLLVIVSVINICNSQSDVIVLDESNFEHLTQASTGGTTGDWLIEFYAPWCGHCKKLAPTWEEVATGLKGKINVAKVDATANKGLSKRFGIKGYPSIIMLRKGKLQKHSGQRTKESISEWALTVEPTENIPPPLSAVDNIVSTSLGIVEETLGLISQKTKPACIILMVGALIGFLFGILVSATCCHSSTTNIPRVPVSQQMPHQMNQSQPKRQDVSDKGQDSAQIPASDKEDEEDERDEYPSNVYESDEESSSGRDDPAVKKNN
jgi:protein disulfide-isomerase-like protein